MRFIYPISITLISVLFYSNPNANYILNTIQLEFLAINRTAPEAVDVIVLIGTSVKQVMVEATNQNSRYGFGGTYYPDLGWLVEKYDNVSNDLDRNFCWYFYVKTLYDKEPEKETKGVSNCLLTVNATLVIFRYELDKEYCKLSNNIMGTKPDI